MRNRTEDQVTLALIRHGETKANGEHRYLGKTDEILSESGREKLLLYKSRKMYPDINYLFTSPMKRCMETARILYPGLRAAVIPEWEEIDFGRFEYKNYQELKRDAQYQAWIDGGGMSGFPEGESRESFIRRCKSGLMRMCDILSAYRDAGKEPAGPMRVGGIVHGGTIMALLSACGKESYFACQVLNGRGYVCRMEGWYHGALQGEDRIKIEVAAKI